jgi:hypothetical protein
MYERQVFSEAEELMVPTACKLGKASRKDLNEMQETRLNVLSTVYGWCFQLSLLCPAELLQKLYHP